MSENNRKKVKIIPGFIAYNFWRKFIALFFAILVWERVTARLDDTQNIRRIPVEINMLGYVMSNDTHVYADVILKGSKQRLNKIKPNDITIEVNLKNPKKGTNKLVIRKSDVSIPKGVAISDIEPDEISIDLDEKWTKKVPVKLKHTGTLMEGYALNTVLLVPQEVTISGPKKIIDTIKDISTKPIILGKDNVEDFDYDKLQLDSKRNITVNPKEVFARIEIYKKYDIRQFKDLLIKPFGYVSKGEKLEIKPQQVSVSLGGAKSAIEVITTDKIRPFIDLSGIEKPGEYTLNVQCWLNNSELSVKEIKPATVNVILSEE